MDGGGDANIVFQSIEEGILMLKEMGSLPNTRELINGFCYLEGPGKVLKP